VADWAWNVQPFSWRAGLLFVVAGAGLLWYFEHEKARMQRKRVAESTKGVGRPKVGGPFELVDQDGRTVTDAHLRGKYSLVRRGLSLLGAVRPAAAGKGIVIGRFWETPIVLT